MARFEEAGLVLSLAEELHLPGKDGLAPLDQVGQISFDRLPGRGVDEDLAVALDLPEQRASVELPGHVDVEDVRDRRQDVDRPSGTRRRRCLRSGPAA